MTDLNEVKKAVKDTVDSTIEKTREAGHRSSADAERIRRDLTGDQMTTTEKVTSAANETKERVAAGIDHAKHEVRNRT
jgi:hypothetical protein